MSDELLSKFEKFKEKYNLLRDTIMQVFIGNEETVRDTIISFIAGPSSRRCCSRVDASVLEAALDSLNIVNASPRGSSGYGGIHFRL